jgi:imidazolonepropionase-like amidohydrolase
VIGTGTSASLLLGAAGKQAELMVLKGNSVANILEIEKVEIVFKEGGELFLETP